MFEWYSKINEFDIFWQELSIFLEECVAFDERRHSDKLHMPIAISIRHLREIIVDRLDNKFPGESKPVPSDSRLASSFGHSTHSGQHL